MSEVIKKVSSDLLLPAGLDASQLEKLLGGMLGPGIDSADIYIQASQDESWYLEDGRVKQGDFSMDRGFGCRVIGGEKVGFAYADDLSTAVLEQASASARSVVSSGSSGQMQVAHSVGVKPLYVSDNPISVYADADKIALMQSIDRYSRQLDPRIKQVFVSLTASYDEVLMMDSAGLLAGDVRPMVGLSVSVIAEQGGRREKGRSGAGARACFDLFLSDNPPLELAKKAVDQALINLEAMPTPAGVMTVALGPGWPAVLLHEAVGHGLEGDCIRKGSSAFVGRMGQRVGSSLCTIVDDGTVLGRRGSLSVDDEGTITERTVLIEQGILKNVMLDKHNALLMGQRSTGNGRRESYADLPLPRMTNTYMLPGESTPEEIISSIDYGLYAVDFSGGQVDITSGKFVFSMSEAYLIENGKISHPVRGATLVGDGPDVLRRVSMVANDFQLDRGVGTCGKSGQCVPVGVGQPTIKVDAITVGGSEVANK